MGKVILVCGKICSGKSYYSKQLKDSLNAVIISPDEATYELINNEQGEFYNIFSERLNKYLTRKVGEIASAGANVIFERGLWSSKDRKEIIYVVPTKTSISINSDVETIKTGSIMNKNITELTIPNNVINMEIYIFSNVTSLRSIKIGSGVANLSPSFKGWGGMPSDVNITIDSSNLNYKTEDNLILTKDGKKVLTYISNNVQSQTIPEGVEILEYNSFEDFQASEIILSNTLKEIGNNCFNLCPNLTEILIPNSVETIASNAFINCANLESIKIDNTAGSIIGAPWSAPKGDRVISWLK